MLVFNFGKPTLAKRFPQQFVFSGFKIQILSDSFHRENQIIYRKNEVADLFSVL